MALAFTFALTACQDDTGVDLEAPAAIESDAADVATEVEADMNDAADATDAALDDAGESLDAAGDEMADEAAEMEEDIEGVE